MKTNIYNLIILDRSGSMETIKKDAINGYNETLGTIKAAQLKYMDTQTHYVTLVAFCGCSVETIYDNADAKDAEKLNAEKYQPCCSTPLLDAIGSSVQQLRKKVGDDKEAEILVTIITDGEENSSKEWRWEAVKKLIEELKEQGWMFSFIGAMENVIEIATSISITNTMQWDNTPEGTQAMFECENQARSRYFNRINECAASIMSEDEKKAAKKKRSESYFNDL